MKSKDFYKYYLGIRNRETGGGCVLWKERELVSTPLKQHTQDEGNRLLTLVRPYLFISFLILQIKLFMLVH